jgi:hypothetical protein
MGHDPQSLRQRARLGGLATAARHDPKVFTGPARKASAEALNCRLLAEIDPDNQLDPKERQRRLIAARKLHFARLAFNRDEKRRKAKKAGSTRSIANQAGKSRHGQ